MVTLSSRTRRYVLATGITFLAYSVGMFAVSASGTTTVIGPNDPSAESKPASPEVIYDLRGDDDKAKSEASTDENAGDDSSDNSSPEAAPAAPTDPVPPAEPEPPTPPADGSSVPATDTNPRPQPSTPQPNSYAPAHGIYATPQPATPYPNPPARMLTPTVRVYRYPLPQYRSPYYGPYNYGRPHTRARPPMRYRR